MAQNIILVCAVIFLFLASLAAVCWINFRNRCVAFEKKKAFFQSSKLFEQDQTFKRLELDLENNKKRAIPPPVQIESTTVNGVDDEEKGFSTSPRKIGFSVASGTKDKSLSSSESISVFDLARRKQSEDKEKKISTNDLLEISRKKSIAVKNITERQGVPAERKKGKQEDEDEKKGPSATKSARVTVAKITDHGLTDDQSNSNPRFSPDAQKNSPINEDEVVRSPMSKSISIMQMHSLASMDVEPPSQSKHPKTSIIEANSPSFTPSSFDASILKVGVTPINEYGFNPNSIAAALEIAPAHSCTVAITGIKLGQAVLALRLVSRDKRTLILQNIPISDFKTHLLTYATNEWLEIPPEVYTCLFELSAYDHGEASGNKNGFNPSGLAAAIEALPMLQAVESVAMLKPFQASQVLKQLKQDKAQDIIDLTPKSNFKTDVLNLMDPIFSKKPTHAGASSAVSKKTMGIPLPEPVDIINMSTYTGEIGLMTKAMDNEN